MPAYKTKILLADNHLLIREGIKALLNSNKDFKIVGEALDGKELTKKITQLKPDVVIIDFHLPGFFSVEDVGKIYKHSHKSNVLVITTNQDKNDINKVLEYGVNNYILKLCDKDEFISAVYATAKKERFFCGRVVDAILEKQFPKNEHCEAAGLSKIEEEIFKQIAEGLTNKEIADKRFRSIHTIATHRKNLLKKLKLKTKTEIVMYAIKTGVIDAPGK